MAEGIVHCTHRGRGLFSGTVGREHVENRDGLILGQSIVICVGHDRRRHATRQCNEAAGLGRGFRLAESSKRGRIATRRFTAA